MARHRFRARTRTVTRYIRTRARRSYARTMPRATRRSSGGGLALADKMILTIGGLSGALILLSEPIEKALSAGDVKQGIVEGTTAVRDLPASRYFEAIAPPLAAGVAVVVRRGASGVARGFLQGISRAVGGR